MRKLLLSYLLCLPLLMLTSCGDKNEVYICTGLKAKVYHKTKSCKGLRRCGGEIKAVSLEEIKESRRACKICY